MASALIIIGGGWAGKDVDVVCDTSALAVAIVYMDRAILSLTWISRKEDRCSGQRTSHSLASVDKSGT